MLGVVFLMGMYDNLKISTSKLPLSDSEKLAIGENPDWQTCLYTVLCAVFYSQI